MFVDNQTQTKDTNVFYIYKLQQVQYPASTAPLHLAPSSLLKIRTTKSNLLTKP